MSRDRNVIAASEGGVLSGPLAPLVTEASHVYADRARRVIVRGVASASRATRRPVPLLFERGHGSRLVDADGNVYIDYCLAFGPLLLGHSPVRVTDAVVEQTRRGVLYGGQQEAEAQLAERIARLVPVAELVAFALSGSDAVHLAIRIARASTGRRKILKFEGHYHGWIEPVFVNVPGVIPQRGTGALSVVHAVEGLAAPDDVLVARWDDISALESVLEEHPDEIALIVMEPIPCNFGAFEPAARYLADVKRLCAEHGCLLCFDEVITGFRLGLGGAQERLGVVPDLAVYAKALASGFPISLVVGSEPVMAPAASGPVSVLGTYNGHGASLAAALATLDQLEEGGPALYADLGRHAARLQEGFRAAAADAGAPLVVNRVGSVLQLYWATPDPVSSYGDGWCTVSGAIADLALLLLGERIYILERGLMFVSTAHTDEDIEATVGAARGAIAAVAEAYQDGS